MKASECKCIVCGKQAVAFWPIIDPDIPAQPYCRKCLDEAKNELLVKSFGYDEKIADVFIKMSKQEKDIRK